RGRWQDAEFQALLTRGRIIDRSAGELRLEPVVEAEERASLQAALKRWEDERTTISAENRFLLDRSLELWLAERTRILAEQQLQPPRLSDVAPTQIAPPRADPDAPTRDWGPRSSPDDLSAGPVGGRTPVGPNLRNSEQVKQLIGTAFGRYVPAERLADMQAIPAVGYERAELEQRYRDARGAELHPRARAWWNSADREVAMEKGQVGSHELVHEYLHTVQNPVLRQLGFTLNEAFTEYFARKL